MNAQSNPNKPSLKSRQSSPNCKYTFLWCTASHSRSHLLLLLTIQVQLNALRRLVSVNKDRSFEWINISVVSGRDTLVVTANPQSSTMEDTTPASMKDVLSNIHTHPLINEGWLSPQTCLHTNRSWSSAPCCYTRIMQSLYHWQESSVAIHYLCFHVQPHSNTTIY